MRGVAIIPARGGSKRLPRKNIADFHGKPIIAYSIAAAVESGCFEQVVVSTEDAEIAEIASRFGARIDMRDPSLATDAATVDQVCLDFLDRERQAGNDWKRMACLYATAPLRNSLDVAAVVGLLKEGECDFAMGVSAYQIQPNLALKFLPDGELLPMWPELIELRADKLPPLRASNGTTYAVECDAFKKYKTFYGPGLRGYDMPRIRGVDIDTADDLDYALWLARRIWGDGCG